MVFLKKLLKSLVALGALGPVLGFAVLAPGVGVIVLTTTSSQWYPPLQESVVGQLLFILVATLLCGLSLIPTHACSLISGLLFGPWIGSLLALMTVSGASLIGHQFFGRIIGEGPLEHLKKKKKVSEIYSELIKAETSRTFWLIFLLRLSPLMPFAATNAFLSSLKIPLGVFFLGSVIGLAPRVIGVVLIGSTLKALELGKGGHPVFLVIGIIATVALPIYIHQILRRKLSKKLNAEMEDPSLGTEGA